MVATCLHPKYRISSNKCSLPDNGASQNCDKMSVKLTHRVFIYNWVKYPVTWPVDLYRELVLLELLTFCGSVPAGSHSCRGLAAFLRQTFTDYHFKNCVGTCNHLGCWPPQQTQMTAAVSTAKINYAKVRFWNCCCSFALPALTYSFSHLWSCAEIKMVWRYPENLCTVTD